MARQKQLDEPDWKEQTDNLEPLLDMVLEHVPSQKIEEGTPQLLITSLDFSSYTGRIAIGRLQRGTLTAGMQVSLVNREGEVSKQRIKELNLLTV